MCHKVDEQQRHICYETCVDCSGTFFDAGEFLDLSQLTDRLGKLPLFGQARGVLKERL
jgi:hypothetical protein